MRIAILDDYTDAVRTLGCFERFAGHDVTVLTEHVADVHELAARLDGIEVLALNRERTAVTEALLARLPSLRLLSLIGGTPHVDLDACRRHGVTVCVGEDTATPTHATAELTWGVILSASRRLPEQVASVLAGGWQTGIGSTLHGATLGILGYGGLGSLVAGYGRAFGMQVLVWSGESSRELAQRDGFDVAENQRQLFADSDVLTVHVRLDGGTRGLVTTDDLTAMRPTALFVNTSRAAIVEPGALAAALDAGRPGRAAVDVYDAEPTDVFDDPLVSRPELHPTPHLGYVTRESYEQMYAAIADQIDAFAAGDPIAVVP